MLYNYIVVDGILPWSNKTWPPFTSHLCLFLFFLSFQDDIIDDVGDFVAAAEILKERGAYKIYIMATHGLLSADAPRLIEESAIDEVSIAKLVVSNHMYPF